MNDSIITLVCELDEDTEEKTEVFADIESVSQSEFFSAAQAGFRSEYKVTLWQGDYDGQDIVEIDENRFSVYRRYLRYDEKIELYLTSKIGV